MAQQPRNLGQAVALFVQVSGKRSPKAMGTHPIQSHHLAGIAQHLIRRLSADVATLPVVVSWEQVPSIGGIVGRQKWPQRIDHHRYPWLLSLGVLTPEADPIAGHVAHIEAQHLRNSGAGEVGDRKDHPPLLIGQLGKDGPQVFSAQVAGLAPPGHLAGLGQLDRPQFKI